ncbi:hypothetical protein B0T22DRAFT_485348 [Podospora appendiculata]|uniref:Uncharacterized protein n=1 Tax=Podospora appendiculata TaxID=314037 RepID=A0AAE0WZS5_9PEZI|nr:hypothetical protein B0T22DRAFT_485348 [Podospora appendiculata]
MDSDREPKLPTTVTRRPFTWGPSDGLKAGGIGRAATDELRLLFRKGAAQFRLDKATRPWITAQLRLYGVPFDIECIVPTPEVEAAEHALRLKCKAAVEKHPQLVRQCKDKNFAKVEGGPTDEAAFDADRFLAKYFLDGLHGRPDRAKTKEPVALSLHVPCYDNLENAIQAIPGLAFHAPRHLGMSVVGWDTELDRGIEREFAKLSSGSDGISDVYTPTREAAYDFNRFLQKYFRVDVNGVATGTQDKEKPSAPVTLYSFFSAGFALVDAEVARMEEKYRLKEEEIRRQDEEWAAEDKARREEAVRSIYRPHHEFVARQKSGAAKPEVFTLDQLVGSYVVRWDGKDGANYSDQVNNQLTLDVFPAKSTHGVTASFSFGFFEGTMLLALSQREVVLLRDEQKKDNPYAESDTKSDLVGTGYGRDEDERADIIDSLGFVISTANASPAGPAHPSTPTDKKRRVGDVADPWGVQAALAKRQKPNVRVKKEEDDDDENVGAKPLVKIKKEEEEEEDAKPLAKTDTEPSRFYFQFAYSIVEGYPDVDDENQNVGYIDFDMSSSSGAGVFHICCWFSGPQHFSIFKVAGEPSGNKEPMSWFEFDGRR